jgi:hypothetical protein
MVMKMKLTQTRSFLKSVVILATALFIIIPASVMLFPIHSHSEAPRYVASGIASAQPDDSPLPPYPGPDDFEDTPTIIISSSSGGSTGSNNQAGGSSSSGEDDENDDDDIPDDTKNESSAPSSGFEGSWGYDSGTGDTPVVISKIKGRIAITLSGGYVLGLRGEFKEKRIALQLEFQGSSGSFHGKFSFIEQFSECSYILYDTEYINGKYLYDEKSGMFEAWFYMDSTLFYIKGLLGL